MPGEHRPSPRALLGVALGVVGIVVLLWPELRHTSGIGRREFLASLSLLGAALSWALGSVLSKRSTLRVDAFSAAGWQMVFGGLANLVLGLALGEFRTLHWSATSWGAVLYLIVFGSWVGYTAYIWLLDNVATAKVATYAYVNPVVAVFLGWLVLHERVTGYVLGGWVVIVAAVALVTGAKLKSRTGGPEAPRSRALERRPATESRASERRPRGFCGRC